ncbi:MAG: hypothetical protein EOP06_00100 [Proteobacteria bacterium]|nr:MAG: hypothetical protein EOP06_00100 [Pseudomonadota bacterium]
MMKFILAAAVLSTSMTAFAESSDFERGFQSAANLCANTVVKCVYPKDGLDFTSTSSEGTGRTETLAKNAWLVKCMAGQTRSASSKESCEKNSLQLKCVEVSR